MRERETERQRQRQRDRDRDRERAVRKWNDWVGIKYWKGEVTNIYFSGCIGSGKSISDSQIKKIYD